MTDPARPAPPSLTRQQLLKIERKSCFIKRTDDNPIGQIEYVAMAPDPDGPWIRFTDADALASEVDARLAQQEGLITSLEYHCKQLESDREYNAGLVVELRARLAQDAETRDELLRVVAELEAQVTADAATIAALRAEQSFPVLAFLRSLPDVPCPEITIEPDGELGFDWNHGPRNVFSASLGVNGRIAWASLSDDITVHGRFDLSDGRWPEDARQALLRVIARAENQSAPQVLLRCSVCGYTHGRVLTDQPQICFYGPQQCRGVMQPVEQGEKTDEQETT